MLHTILMMIHFFCAVGIVALVLLQRGQGADAGAGFGAGASGTVFGARGASTALSRTTAVLAAVFMITSLSLAYVGRDQSATPATSILDRISQQAGKTATTSAAAPATAATPAIPAAPAVPATSTPVQPAPKP